MTRELKDWLIFHDNDSTHRLLVVKKYVESERLNVAFIPDILQNVFQSKNTVLCWKGMLSRRLMEIYSTLALQDQWATFQTR